MAGEPEWALILLGMGLDEFSASPSSIPEIKKVIRSVKYSDAQKLANEVMSLEDSDKIHKKVNVFLKKILPQMVKSNSALTTTGSAKKRLFKEV